MKFIERVLILMFIIGLYFVIGQKRADPTVILFSAVSFSVFYILCMHLLLQGVGFNAYFKKGSQLKLAKIFVGLLFGLLSAYIIFSVAYHQLGKMDNIAIIENCGIFLALFAIISFIGWRKKQDIFYRNMLIRTGILGLVILGSFILKMIFTGLQ